MTSSTRLLSNWLERTNAAACRIFSKAVALTRTQLRDSIVAELRVFPKAKKSVVALANDRADFKLSLRSWSKRRSVISSDVFASALPAREPKASSASSRACSVLSYAYAIRRATIFWEGW